VTPEGLARIHAGAFGHKAWSAAEFQTLLAHPGAILSADDRGFALLRIVLDEAEVLTLATDPAHRRKGVARFHLGESERQALEQGATTVFLEVAADNAPARMLYEGFGYRPAGIRNGYYRRSNVPAVDALMLRKDLRPA